MFKSTIRCVKRSDLFGPLLKIKQSKKVFVCGAASGVRCHMPNMVIPDVTLPQFIFQDFSKYPHKTALECAETGRKYTFEELRRKSLNLNKALRTKYNLKRNDIVAVILPNVPEYPICLFGILQAGLRVTTVNSFGTTDDVKYQLIDTDAKAIFTTCQLGEFAKNVLQQLQRRIPIITIKTEVSDTIPEGAVNFQELTDIVCDVEDVVHCNTHEIAIIPYSSGTTGKQKGVLHSHNTLIALISAMNCDQLFRVKATTGNYQDSTPAFLPFFHIYGLTVLLLSHLYNLAKVVTIPKFKTNIFLDTILKHKPTILCVVPPMALFLANHSSVKKEHFESVEGIYCGAAPLGSSDEAKLIARSEKDLKICQGYGLTEAPVVTVNFKNIIVPPGSVGRVLQNTEVKIVPVENPKSAHLGPNQSGELLCKGPQVMLGYFNRPKESEDTFVDGWLRTGDLVYFDEHNNLFVKDRLKELIKVKGYQVPPAELEELIRTYPNVCDAVVIGIPHDQYGEVPRAYLTIKADSKINLKDLEEYVTSKVAKYKRIIGGFAVVDSVPKTASGKYLRKDLKLQYMNELK